MHVGVGGGIGVGQSEPEPAHPSSTTAIEQSNAIAILRTVTSSAPGCLRLLAC